MRYLRGRHQKELEEAVAAAVATAEAREERGAAEAALRAQMSDERRSGSLLFKVS